MKTNTKVAIIVTAIISGLLSHVLLLFSGIQLLLVLALNDDKNYDEIYSTESIEDYGIYEGRYDTEAVAEHISSLFPSEIEESFSDVQYSFCASESPEDYAYEAYLEFVIEDDEEFENFRQRVVGDLPSSVFEYDESFIQYTQCKNMSISAFHGDGGVNYPPHDILIGSTQIGIILVSSDSNRFIFWQLRAEANTFYTCDMTTRFFTRFNINPMEYTDDITYH